MPQHARTTTALVAVVGLGLVALAAGCDTNDGRALADPEPGATAPPVPESTTTAPVSMNPPVGSSDTSGLALTSPVVAAGGVLPTEFSCFGANTSLPVDWTGVPIEAVELVVTLVDVTPAADTDDEFVHWTVAGLDPTVIGLAAGSDVVGLEGAVVGRNDSTEFGWYGPCPPAGEQHTYVLSLYALRERSGIQTGASGDEIIATAQARMLSSAALSFTFTAP